MTFKISKWIYPDGTFWRVHLNGYLCSPPGLKFEDNKFASEEEAFKATISLGTKVKVLEPLIKELHKDCEEFYTGYNWSEYSIQNTAENLALVKEFNKSRGDDSLIRFDNDGNILTWTEIKRFALGKIL
jgi:hypothetical protein